MNQWRKSHMTLNDYMDKGREEGLEEGRREESERYDKLIEFLVRDNNFTDFDKISRDNNYLQEMFKHYGL
jgi:hypothetical protein